MTEGQAPITLWLTCFLPLAPLSFKTTQELRCEDHHFVFRERNSWKTRKGEAEKPIQIAVCLALGRRGEGSDRNLRLVTYLFL